MCGRYASFREAQDLADHFAVTTVADDARELPPSWNVAPTDPVRVVVERTPAVQESAVQEGAVQERAVRSLRVARWGLVPGWAKDPRIGARMINARMESLDEKPAFRKALAVRRCLVPAEGYYEWQAPPEGAPRGTKKQPYWIHDPDGRPLAFAGLYEFWRDPAADDDDPHRWLVTTTVVTGGAPTDDPALAAIHDRRPVVLPADRWDAWLDPSRTDVRESVELLQGAAPRLVARAVSTEVNRVGTNGAQLVSPLEPDAPEDAVDPDRPVGR